MIVIISNVTFVIQDRPNGTSTEKIDALIENMTFSESEISQSESVTDDTRNRENKFMKQRKKRATTWIICRTYLFNTDSDSPNAIFNHQKS